MSGFDTIYEEGQETAWAGLQESNNPYPIGSEEAMSWNDGFNNSRSNA